MSEQSNSANLDGKPKRKKRELSQDQLDALAARAAARVELQLKQKVKPKGTAAQRETRAAQKEREALGLPKRRPGRPKTDEAAREARGAFRVNASRASGYQPPPGPAPVVAPAPSATKNYVQIAEEYARDVVAGKIEVCEAAIAACRRHLDNRARSLTDPSYPYYFDETAANTFCRNAERYPHIKGRWAAKGEHVDLSPWQCFILVVPFGWKRKSDDLRRFREMYVQVPRKNGKSTIAAAIGNNMLLADGEHGAEVYAGATSEKQAWEVFGPAKLMLQRSPALLREYGATIWAKAIVKEEDNSKFWPVIGNPGDGSSPHCAIVDEYHEHVTSNLLDTMVTGMGAREQPMVVIITTAGVNLAAPCYDKYLEAKRVLAGTIENEQLFAIIYEIDSRQDHEDDWTDPAMIRKANPNLGISVSEDYLLSQLRQAVQNPSYQNRYKTKHLNVWCAASVAGINMADWRRCADPTLRVENFVGEQCWDAVDLASKIDVADYVKVFKKRINDEDHYYAFCRHYLPEQTIEEATHNQQSYRRWVAQGHIIVSPGSEIDFDMIRDDLIADTARYMVEEVVYDPWRATQLAHQLAKEGAKVVELGQTAKNMGAAFDEFTSAIKSGRFHHDGDPVLEWMASNVVAKEAAKGLVVPSKEKREQKIDGIVAVVMAISRAMLVEAGGFLMNPVMVEG